MEGYLSSELQVGDVVAIRREAFSRREGPLRFQQRTYPHLYRMSKKVSTNTVVVESVTHRTSVRFCSLCMLIGWSRWTCPSWLWILGPLGSLRLMLKRRILGSRGLLSVSLLTVELGLGMLSCPRVVSG